MAKLVAPSNIKEQSKTQKKDSGHPCVCAEDKGKEKTKATTQEKWKKTTTEYVVQQTWRGCTTNRTRKPKKSSGKGN